MLALKALAAKATGASIANHHSKTSVTLDPDETSLENIGTGSLQQYAKNTGRQQLKVRADHAVMRMWIAAGLPPAIFDYPEWKELCGVLNPTYEPLTRTMYTEVILPTEQAHIQVQQLEYLQTKHYLTLTFDGGTTRRQDGFYTIHVCTPDSEEFLVEMVDGRGVAHTGTWIKGHLKRVCPNHKFKSAC